MGICLSSWINDFDKNETLSPSTTTNVITINGELRRFTLPIKVSQILLQLHDSASSSFICNSDNLYYDQITPALRSDCELQSGQIYFVLPNTKLHYPLTPSEMASLAVKATTALSAGKNGGIMSSYYNYKSRVSPFLVTEEQNDGELLSYKNNLGKMTGTGTTRITRSGSIRKFRVGLKTIYE